MSNRLIDDWKKATQDFGLEIVESFIYQTISGKQLQSVLLIKDIGAPKGMLIFMDFKNVKKYQDELLDAGYGYSILEEPDDNDEYNKEEYFEMLSDWGWKKHGDT